MYEYMHVYIYICMYGTSTSKGRKKEAKLGRNEGKDERKEGMEGRKEGRKGTHPFLHQVVFSL
jgi:hypothetical protein